MPNVPTDFPTVNHVNKSFRDYMKISNSSFHKYYGTYERFTHTDYEKAAVFVIPGNGVGMADFFDNGGWDGFHESVQGHT